MVVGWLYRWCVVAVVSLFAVVLPFSFSVTCNDQSLIVCASGVVVNQLFWRKRRKRVRTMVLLLWDALVWPRASEVRDVSVSVRVFME